MSEGQEKMDFQLSKEANVDLPLPFCSVQTLQQIR